MNKNKILEGTPYEIFAQYNGLYESPKDKLGNYLGPLVFYAGTYIDENEEKKNYVGFCYFNVAKIEQLPETREYFSNLLAKKIQTDFNFHCHLVAAPMGGIIFATATADKLLFPVSFFEKKVSKVADPENGIKEKSELVYKRHSIQLGGNYIIFEDLCNNFSTTQKMIDYIKSAGGNVVAIACVINRSNKTSFGDVPVISAIHLPSPEFKQDDKEVQKLMKDCNFVTEPKKDWDFLKKEMEKGNN